MILFKCKPTYRYANLRHRRLHKPQHTSSSTTVEDELWAAHVSGSTIQHKLMYKHVYSTMKYENFCKYSISPTYNFV